MRVFALNDVITDEADVIRLSSDADVMRELRSYVGTLGTSTNYKIYVSSNEYDSEIEALRKRGFDITVVNTSH